MTNQARIFQINRSNGGVPKLAIPSVQISSEGLQGDWQKDRVHHGGIERAVCLYSLELILKLQQEGHPIFPGSAGENLTLSGLDWDQFLAGRVLRLGESVELELTRPTTPCNSITGSFRDLDSQRISHKLYPGWSRWYARVNQGGHVQVGDLVKLV